MTKAEFIAQRKEEVLTDYTLLRKDKTKHRLEVLEILAKKYQVQPLTLIQIMSKKNYPKKKPTKSKVQ